MPIGSLRHRVGFYRRPASDASPDYGTVDGEFSATADYTCAAEIRPRLGGEGVLAGRLSGSNLVTITVRDCAALALLDAGWKVRDERAGIDYNIRSIIDPEQASARRGRWLELLCEQGVAV